MVKKKWKLLSWLTACVWLLMGTIALAASGQVFDEGNLFSAQEQTALKEQTESLRLNYDMNFVVVTTNDAKGKSAQAFADDFDMDNGFYEDEQVGGVTLLIDMDNRELYVSSAGNMQYYLTDEHVEAVLDAGYGKLQEGEYATCINEMLEQVTYWVDQGVDPNQYTYDPETNRIKRYKSIRPTDVLIGVAGALLAGGLACGGVIGKYKMKWGDYTYPFRKHGAIQVSGKEDQLVNQFVTQRRIPRNPDGGRGGGGSGGGGMTTIHTSSGGGSFGGGGRKF